MRYPALEVLSHLKKEANFWNGLTVTITLAMPSCRRLRTITVYLTKPYQALKLRADKSTWTLNKLSHKVNNFAPGNHDFIAVVVF